ncbi:MAG: helix-turn-helix domain-containing protein [Flammeovirgaceae bacterium]|nr:helix-turn-helix domain-containing protein [Flammeovirgaceae bacterium]
MMPELSKVKGVHPGAILKRELKKRGIRNKELALSINEHPETISAILKEKRGINPKLSIKLGNEFGAESDCFMLLQASYDVKKEQLKSPQPKPDLTQIRKSLFWDTNFDRIDWDKNKMSIIRRVFERGNEEEINEIISFYGKESVKKELRGEENDFLPSFRENIETYIEKE